MFLVVDNGKMINIDNVDVIDMYWNDEDQEGAVTYWKCYYNDHTNRDRIGEVRFNDKSDFKKYIENELVPLSHDYSEKTARAIMNINKIVGLEEGYIKKLENLIKEVKVNV